MVAELLVPFDVSVEDVVGPGSWATNYGKSPEIIAVPIAVELGSFDAGVADSRSASVVTRSMRTVDTPKTSSSGGAARAIQPEIPGASEVPIQVMPTTIAVRNRYCGIVGA